MIHNLVAAFLILHKEQMKAQSPLFILGSLAKIVSLLSMSKDSFDILIQIHYLSKNTNESKYMCTP